MQLKRLPESPANRLTLSPSLLATHCSNPNNSESIPYLNDLNLLSPACEEFNQYLWESQRADSESDTSSLNSNDLFVVAVIGVGYVGYQLVRAFAKHYPVVAYDVSKQRIEAIRNDFEKTSVYFTSDPMEISQATHILIAVPTGVHREDKSVDTSYLKSAVGTVARYARSGAVVVVESSVAVGMTRDLLTPLQHLRGIKAGMSPERVDPGRVDVGFESIPKIVSGLDNESLHAIQELYETVFNHVVPVSSCEVAEMTKLYENCQRMIGIAFANEMADACQTFSIDPIEVCSAAGTKPFGYQAYAPGAGVGGHCIPVNPYYLLSNMQFPLLQTATEKMWQRPAALVDRVMNVLSTNTTSRKIRSTLTSSLCQSYISGPNPRILVIGVAFKPGQSVTSHSPGIAMIEHLGERYNDVNVDFCDPLIGAETISQAIKLDDRVDWNAETLDNRYDAIIVAMAQHGLDFDILTSLQRAKVFNFSSSLKEIGFASL